MSAIDDALRAMDRYVSARQPARAKPKPKRATKASAALYTKLQSAGIPRHEARREARKLEYTPPRSEPDVSELAESFAPAPTPPEVEGRISAPLYVPPVVPVVFDAISGRIEGADWVDGRVTERPGLGGGGIPSSPRHSPRWRAPRRLEGAST